MKIFNSKGKLIQEIKPDKIILSNTRNDLKLDIEPILSITKEHTFSDNNEFIIDEGVILGLKGNQLIIGVVLNQEYSSIFTIDFEIFRKIISNITCLDSMLTKTDWEILKELIK